MFLGQITEKSNRLRTETILDILLKFQFNRNLSANFDVKTLLLKNRLYIAIRSVVANLKLGNARKSFSPLIPSPILPCPLPFPCPSLPSFLPSLPLEVGPRKSSYGVGRALYAPAMAFSAEPQPKSNLKHFSFKI